MKVWLENDRSLSGGDTRSLLGVKLKIKIFVLLGGGDAKTLVEFPLPNDIMTVALTNQPL